MSERAWIFGADYYPVYEIHEKLQYRGTVLVDVDAETLARWERVVSEFRRMQEEMSVARHAAPHRAVYYDNPLAEAADVCGACWMPWPCPLGRES